MDYGEFNGAKYRFDPANKTLFLKLANQPEQPITAPNALTISKFAWSRGAVITAEGYNR